MKERVSRVLDDPRTPFVLGVVGLVLSVTALILIGLGY